MTTITESVYVRDFTGLWRIDGVVDTDGIFYATIASWDNACKEWDTDILTQFQQDSKQVLPIAADPKEQVLRWFGFYRSNIIDNPTNDEGEVKVSKYIIEQKYETWYRVEVEAGSLDEAVELGLAALSNGDGHDTECGEFRDEYWAEDVEADESGMVELHGESWVII
jgi:hypothetical protein